MIKNKKIYGDRICKACKALCHKNSYRTTHRIRNSYYCSKGCLGRNKKSIKCMGAGISIEWVIKQCFEQVDVFTTEDTKINNNLTKQEGQDE